MTILKFIYVSFLFSFVRGNNLQGGNLLSSRRRCEFIEDLKGTQNETEIVCGKESNFCFALWNLTKNEDNSTKIHIIKQGCWEASPPTISSNKIQSNCLTSNCTAYISSNTQIKSHPFFCCCLGDNCNSVVQLEEFEEEEDYELEIENQSTNLNFFLWIVFGVFVCFAILTVFGVKYFLNKKKNGKFGDNLEIELNKDEDQETLLCNELLHRNLKGKSMTFDVQHCIATGRWGRVHTSPDPSDPSQNLALKIYSKAHSEFYENEKFIYECIGLNENIIRYHGYQELENSLILGFDLVDYNLRDYLKANSICLNKVVHICYEISKGLAFLHSGYQDQKWTIAHRDLTTRNILIDSNTNRVYLADFGLSLLTRGSKYYYGGKERQAEFCSLAEAGTLRYMAPELLEGAVNLKDCENALKQADVYSLSLIIWEVCNSSWQARFDLHDTETAGHQLPFQMEAEKENLSLDDIVRLVVQARVRPSFTSWLDIGLTRSIRDTLNESWDSEPDARLTSLCIVERIHELKTNFKKMVAKPNPLTPLEIKSTLVDSPWTGRNPCMERNLHIEYESSMADSVTTMGTNLSSSSAGGPFGEKIINTNAQSVNPNTPMVQTQPKPIPLILNIVK